MIFTRPLGVSAIALCLLAPDLNLWAASGSQTSPEPTSFEAVTRQLDPNGGFYFYLSSENFMKEVPESLSKIIPQLLEVGKLNGKENQQAREIWSMASQLGSSSGIADISGFGASSIALEKGYYKTKWALHHYAGKGQGFLWSMTGTQASALDIVSYLPKTTALAFSGDLTVLPLWKALNGQAANNQDLKGGLMLAGAQIEAALGMKLEAFLAAMGPNYSMLLTLDPTRKTTLPGGPGKTALTVPEPTLAICLQVQDEALLTRLEKEISQLPGVVHADKGDFKVRVMPSPIPLPFVRPTVAWKKGLIIVSTQEALVNEMLAVKAGKSPGISSVPQFSNMMKTMPASACQFQFTAPIFQQTLTEVQMSGLQAINTQDPAMAKLFSALKPAVEPRWSCSVIQNTPTGLVGEMRGQSGAAEIVAVGAVAPVALLSAVAVPNFLRARKRSQATAVLEEIRLIDGAKDQWAIENNRPGTATPTWSELTPYFKQGSRLSLLASPKDILNNDIRLNIVDELPTISERTVDQFKDVVSDKASFWGSYAP